MVYALIVRCPIFRGKLKKYDASKAMAVKGVKKVLFTAKIGGVSGDAPAKLTGKSANRVYW